MAGFPGKSLNLGFFRTWFSRFYHPRVGEIDKRPLSCHKTGGGALFFVFGASIEPYGIPFDSDLGSTPKEFS